MREIAARLHRPIALLQDLSGPKIRTGKVKDGVVELVNGRAHRDHHRHRDRGHAPSSSPPPTTALPRDVKPGDRILLDDGNLELRVVGHRRRARRVRGGGRRAAALEQGHEPAGVALSTPALTEKDRRDLAFGIQHRVDFVAMSFVRQAEDVLRGEGAHRARWAAARP